MAAAVRTISAPGRNLTHSGAEPYTVTLTTAGDLLIALIAWFQGEGAVITGITGGGTWVEAATLALDANSHISIWYAPNVSAVTAITITTNDDGTPEAQLEPVFLHCSGMALAAPLGVTPAATTGSSATPSITTGTLPQADGIAVSINSHTGATLTGMAHDSGDGFSEASENLDNDNGQTFEAQYKVTVATTTIVIGATYTGSASGVRNWGAIAASFNAAASAGSILRQMQAHH